LLFIGACLLVVGGGNLFDGRFKMNEGWLGTREGDMRNTLAAIGLSLLTIAPVSAEEAASGSGLLMDCEGRAVSFCYGYLLGVWDGIAEDSDVMVRLPLPRVSAPSGQ
jgi:hypothetical protein